MTERDIAGLVERLLTKVEVDFVADSSKFFGLRRVEKPDKDCQKAAAALTALQQEREQLLEALALIASLPRRQTFVGDVRRIAEAALARRDKALAAVEKDTAARR